MKWSTVSPWTGDTRRGSGWGASSSIQVSSTLVIGAGAVVQSLLRVAAERTPLEADGPFGLLPDAVFISASRGDGIARLRDRIAELLPRPEVELELLLPYTKGSLVARIHAEGEVLAENHTPEGTRLCARVGSDLSRRRGAPTPDRPPPRVRRPAAVRAPRPTRRRGPSEQ